MRLSTRKLLDRSFSGLGMLSIAVMALALVFLLAPIVSRGVGAFIFRETVEHRRFLMERFDRGDREELDRDIAAAMQARRPVYEAVAEFKRKLEGEGVDRKERRRLRREYREAFLEVEDHLHRLLGPFPGQDKPILVGQQYGQTRWDRVEVTAEEVLYQETWEFPDPTKPGVRVLKPRAETQFQGSGLEPMFAYIDGHLEEMLRPEWTFYWGFFTDVSFDQHMLGGIWAALLGTFYLTVGAMLIATPLGVIAAIYFVEYARETWFISILRVCVSTLAGVPSIVFGLFALAFLINTLDMPKSVLAGSITLALLVLPTVIRASEEAIRSVPNTYREAAMGLGAGKWRTIVTVILPAAMSGILTGTIISMGRAAGETAPIIFVAAVSLGQPLGIVDTLSHQTEALPWAVYAMCAEHPEVDEIRHMQYGMVLALVSLVLALNLAAIFLRARIANKLRG